MLEFTTIVDKLKRLTGKKRDVEIANLLNADSAKFAQWKKRNTIPIQELVSYSIENDVDMDYLLKNDIESNQSNYQSGDNNSNSQVNIGGNSDGDINTSITTSKEDDEFLKAYANLSDKKKQYFYHMIMAESFREE